MKILFVMNRTVNAGSVQAVAGYVRAARETGHSVALYGHEDVQYPTVPFTTDVGAFDYVVMIIESGINWLTGLRMPRILAEVSRDRRAILDADGMFNDLININGYDRNHASEDDRSVWVDYYSILSERVAQPTLNPLDARVASLPFYGYNPTLEIPPGKYSTKQFDIMHLGHNWWRGQELNDDLLPALEKIRAEVDGICFVGSWWDGVPPLASDPKLKPAFRIDTDRLKRLHVQLLPAVPYTDVIPTMSMGRVNIMTQRPLLRRLRFLTSKYFEIFCADTVPFVMLDADHAESVYGPSGRALSLCEEPADKIVSAIRNPDEYRDIVADVRRYLAEHHSYRSRLRELIEWLEQ